MEFHATSIAGAFVVELEPQRDARGFFARTWCAQEFDSAGLDARIAQSSLSYNKRRGTVRGMHLQLPPSRESKLVRCNRGVIYDVIVDLRPGSASYLKHFGVELDSRSHRALYIPAHVAHGFQTLEDETQVLYQMSDYHAPELACGFRWNDPAFGIRWPITAGVTIAARDRDYGDFSAGEFAARLAGGTGRAGSTES